MRGIALTQLIHPLVEHIDQSWKSVTCEVNFICRQAYADVMSESTMFHWFFNAWLNGLNPYSAQY